MRVLYINNTKAAKKWHSRSSGSDVCTASQETMSNEVLKE